MIFQWIHFKKKTQDLKSESSFHFIFSLIYASVAFIDFIQSHFNKLPYVQFSTLKGSSQKHNFTKGVYLEFFKFALQLNYFDPPSIHVLYVSTLHPYCDSDYSSINFTLIVLLLIHPHIALLLSSCLGMLTKGGTDSS